MTGLDQYLEKIYNNCRIPFKAYVDGKVVFEADPVYFQSDVVEDDFLLGSSECKLIAPILFKESIELLKFCIKDKFCEYSTDSEKIILDLLNGADISEEKIRDNTKPLKEDSFLVVISVKDKIDEAVEILRDIFERDILVTNKGLKGKVVLVGPTGVGKTTTIAKLAGRLALVEKKKVGLITIDTYRIGAIEQLKTYAEIMNIPFKVVITIKEMEDAIESMSDCDVVLIDTTGRSSKNTMQISELRAFVQKAEPDYVNMVISATTKNKDIKSILKGYSELEYGSVIITKLDETTVYGSIYNISRNANKPVSFITTGQNVPDDIKVSTKEELTRFILGEETLC